jgi:hypothetical protein
MLHVTWLMVHAFWLLLHGVWLMLHGLTAQNLAFAARVQPASGFWCTPPNSAARMKKADSDVGSRRNCG